MKRFTTLFIGAGVALMLAGSAVAGPKTIVSQAAVQVPKTHSETLQTLMTSPQSDSTDRTFDYLARIEKAQFETDLHVTNLRKLLVYKTDDATKKKLYSYMDRQNDLTTLHASVEAMQKSIDNGITQWKKAENAAASGGEVGAQHYARIDTASTKAHEALSSFSETVDHIQAQATRLGDKSLENLASYLSGEEKTLDTVVALTAEPTGTRQAAAPTVTGATVRKTATE